MNKNSPSNTSAEIEVIDQSVNMKKDNMDHSNTIIRQNNMNKSKTNNVFQSSHQHGFHAPNLTPIQFVKNEDRERPCNPVSGQSLSNAILQAVRASKP